MNQSSASTFSIDTAFDDFMRAIGLESVDTGGNIKFSGSDPIFDSPHRLGASISIPIMAAAAATTAIWKMRTGRGQDLQLDLRKAIHGINPVYKFMPTVNGYMLQMPYALDNPMKFDLFNTKDGRQFLPTGVYPHMLHGWCALLECAPSKEAIREAIAKRDGFELEEEVAKAGLIGVVVRSKQEWAEHPLGQFLADQPVVEIIKIGDSEPEPFAQAARPLADIRVMAATHVIAGNVMARTLAEQGADVLHVVRPQEFEHEALFLDPCVGFRSAWMDLSKPDVAETAKRLVKDGDVFVESYRYRSMQKFGMGPEDLAAIRPGIIYASGRCYSYDGPWAERGGFDMEALCVSGFCQEEGSDEEPKFPPTSVMNDYIAGYMGAAGIQAALLRRATEGGSYHVRVNLARCAMWFMSLGLVDSSRNEGDQHAIGEPDVFVASTPYGELSRLAPPVEFSETNGRWENPVLTVRGSCKPEWRA